MKVPYWKILSYKVWDDEFLTDEQMTENHVINVLCDSLCRDKSIEPNCLGAYIKGVEHGKGVNVAYVF